MPLTPSGVFYLRNPQVTSQIRKKMFNW